MGRQIFPLTHVLNAARAVMLDGAGFSEIAPTCCISPLPRSYFSPLAHGRSIGATITREYGCVFYSDNTATACAGNSRSDQRSQPGTHHSLWGRPVDTAPR